MSNSSNAGYASSALPPATGSSKLNVGTTERIISVVAGTILGVFAARKFNSTTGKILAVAGVVLLKRGVTGVCEVNSLMNRNTAHKRASAMEIESTLTIDKSRKEVFTFWRNLENLPRFMKHLKDVTVLDDQRSSWSAKLPGGVGKVSWEAVIEQEEENKLLCWTSLPGSTIDNAGEIQFADAAPGKTEIRAKISYRLPAGDVGSVAGKMFNPVVEKMIKDDLVRFKSLIESGDSAESVSAKSKSSGKRKVGSSVL